MQTKNQSIAPKGDFVIGNFGFGNGSKLPELRQHYLTLGQPQYDAVGNISNAVLLLTFASVLAVRRQITASRPLPAPGPGTAESSDPGTRISDGSLRTPDPAYPPRR